MTTFGKLIVGGILIIVAISVYFFFANKDNDVTPVVNETSDRRADNVTYTNTKYGYSFKYPSIYSIFDEVGGLPSPEYIRVVLNEGVEIDTKTLLLVKYSDQRNDDMPYSEFANISVEADCEPDTGPIVADCTKIEAKKITTTTGISGEMFYMNKKEGSATTKLGPYYVFDISKYNRDPDAKYSILIVQNVSDQATTEMIINDLQFSAPVR